MSTFARDTGMGCGRGVVVSLIAAVIGLPLGLFLVISTILLVTSFDFQPWALCLTALLWLGPAVVAVGLFTRTVRNRSAQLDALFVPLGLEGKAYMSFFRQYHGTRHGRAISAYLWRGPVLLIEVSTPLQTRLGITEHQADTTYAAGLFGRQAMVLNDPSLAALSVFPFDEPWTRTLLADSTATDALRRLTALGSTVFTRQQVILLPGAIRLMLTGNRKLFGLDITAEQTAVWLDDLFRVLDAAEAVPTQPLAAELTSVERLAFKMRTRNPYFELWVMAWMFGFFVIAGIIIFAGVFFFTSLDGF